MREGGDLANLVRSMSPAEKRYFKRFSSRHRNAEKNKYLQLFEAISKQSAYDEAALKLQFVQNGTIVQFSVAKNDLYHLVLQSLRMFHRGKNTVLRLRELLDYIDLLMARGLFSQAKKHCRRAKKIAIEDESQAMMSEILVREMRLCKREWNANSPEVLGALHEDLKQTVLQLQNEIALRALHDQIFPLLASNLEVPRSAYEDEVRKVLNSKLLQDEANALSWNAKIIFHYVHAYGARLLGDIEKVHRHYKMMLALWDGESTRKQKQPQRYLNTLMALLDSMLGIGKMMEFPMILDRIHELKSNRADIVACSFWIAAHLNLRRLIDAGEYVQAKTLLPEINKGLEIHKKYIPAQVQLLFLYHQAVLFLASESYTECLKVINQILAEPESPSRKDIQVASRIFRVLVAFALPELDLLEPYVRSSARFLKSRTAMNPFEKLVLKYVRELDRCIPGKPRDSTWEQFYFALRKLKEETYQHHTGIEQVLLWIEKNWPGSK